MKSSLTARLTGTLFALIAATAAVSMFIVEQFVEDIEDTILDLELKADADYFKQQLLEDRFQPVKTGRLEAVFLPEGEAEAVLPDYFQGRTLPFSARCCIIARDLELAKSLHQHPTVVNLHALALPGPTCFIRCAAKSRQGHPVITISPRRHLVPPL